MITISFHALPTAQEQHPSCFGHNINRINVGEENIKTKLNKTFQIQEL